MRVFIIGRGYPTTKYNMYGIFEFDQAKALEKAGCEVVFLSVDVRSVRRWRKWGSEYKVIDGINIFNVNIPLGKIPLKLKYKISQIALDKLYKKAVSLFGEPNVIHAHFYHMGYISALSKTMKNVPLVITEHSSTIHNLELDSTIKRLAKFGYSKANSVVSVSSSISNHLDKYFDIKSTVIPNIVDTEIFMPSEKTESNTFNFICVASLRKGKALDILLKSFSRSFGNNKDVKLTIVGDGEEKASLKRLSKELELYNQVLFTGRIDREEIAQYLAESDCFILVSKSETFGVAYIEAIAAGLPAIASKCGGPQDFIDHSNGILVDIDDIDGISDTMRYIKDNIGKYDSKLISEEIRRRYSADVVGRKLVKLYEEVTNINTYKGCL